jgi:hypothetical protein
MATSEAICKLKLPRPSPLMNGEVSALLATLSGRSVRCLPLSSFFKARSIIHHAKSPKHEGASRDAPGVTSPTQPFWAEKLSLLQV